MIRYQIVLTYFLRGAVRSKYCLQFFSERADIFGLSSFFFSLDRIESFP